MNKYIKLFIISLLLFCMTLGTINIPLNAVEQPTNETTEDQVDENQANEQESVFSAMDFVLFTNELGTLTQEIVLEKAQVSVPEGTSAFIDESELQALNSMTEEGTKEITIKLEDQSIKVTATIKNSDMMIAPASEVTDGVVTIDIPDYDPATGMVVGEVYSIKVSVPFGDMTSTGKQVKIHIPEGLRYHVIPVTGTPTPGTPEQVATSPFYGFIESFVAPTKQPVYQTFNGDLIYTLLPTTGGVEIDFKIAVDENLYYGPKLFSEDALRGYEGITVTAEKAGSQIGEAKMDINAVGNVTYTYDSVSWKELTALENSSNLLVSPPANPYRYRGTLSISNNYNYVLHAAQYFYFPKEVNFIAALNASRITEVNADEGYVKFETNSYFGTGFGLLTTLTLDTQGTNPGRYVASNAIRTELTMYDGSTIQFLISRGPLVVNVLDSSAITNKLKVGARNTQFFEVSSNYTTGVSTTVENDNLSIKTGQYFEYEIDPNFLAHEVILPVNHATTTQIEYKTNKNNTIQIATGSQILLANKTLSSKINQSSLGLAQDEYITYVRVALPELATGWSSNLLNYVDDRSEQVRGKLQEGVQLATVTVRTYAKDINDDIDLTTLSEATASVTRVDIFPSISTGHYADAFSIVAGETKQAVKFDLRPTTHFYAHTLAMNNPTLYIRLPEGVLINSNSIIAKDTHGNTVPFTVSNPYTSTISGERFIEISFQGAFGTFIDGVTRGLNVTLDYSTTLSAGGNYNWENYAFWMNSVDSLYARRVADTLDVNNNGNTDEFISQASSSIFSIQKNENLLIDTYITPQGDSRRAPFNGTEATAVGFTPGTSADYTLDILNNRLDTVDSVVSYVPIPKEGLDFGTSFQDSPFKWNMKLGVQPTTKVIDEFGNDITATSGSNYTIEYSTNATNATNWESATYSSTFNENATMIRVTNTSGMPSKERATVNFEYIVDETPESVEATPSKLSSINDFRPVYDFVAGVSSGRQFGTRVGAQLVIGEVKGIMFKDVNYDGIYTSGTDLPLSNRDVNLYNSADVLVETVQTDALGEYSFDGLQNGAYRVDFNDGVSGDELFTFANKGVDTALNSHVANVGTNKGLALSVDPTSDRAKYINAGVFDYNPTTQLSVTASEVSVTMPATNAQTSFTRQVNRTIEPTFFNSIRATTDSIVWSSDDTNIATVVGGLITGVNPGTTTVYITITDMFGNTSTDSVAVTVTTNNLPVITASNRTIERFSSFNPLTGVSVSDVEDGSTLVPTVTSNNVDPNTTGSYSVGLSVTDTQGNIVTTTYQVTVQDTTAPVITSSNTHTYERLSTVTAAQFLLDITASMNEAGTLTSDFATAVDLTVSNDYTVTLTATDTVGNITTKTVTVTVEDTTAPVIASDTTHTYERLSTVTAAQFLPDITASMNEAGTLTSNFATTVDLTVSNDYTVTLTATDTAGNTATKTITVTVEDTVAPVITSNDTHTYERTSTVTAAQFLLDLTASMNEAGTLTSNFATAVDLAVSNDYTVTLTATDTAGNITTKQVTVTIEDTTSPVITADTTHTYERTSTVTAAQFLLDITASTDEAGTLTSDFDTVVDLDVNGEYIVTLTGTDASNNVTTKQVTITIEDTVAPTISANLTHTYERATTVSVDQFLIDIAASMNEAGTLTSNFEAVVNLNVSGNYTVTLTGTDASNNISTKEVTVTVADTTALIITSNDAQTYERTTIVSANQFLIDSAASMNEAGTLTSNFDTVVNLDVAGVYSVTLTGTDTSNNVTTKEVTVTVEDTVAPVITANETQTYERTTIVSADQFLLDIEASMNEAGTLTSNFDTVVNLDVAGVYSVTLTGTDTSNNVTTKEVTVTVEDTVAPVITANETHTYELGSTVTSYQFLIDIEASMNEAGTLTSDFDTVVNLDVPGTYTVTLTATDESGNVSTLEVSVIINDSTITYHFEANDVKYTLNEVKALIAEGKIEEDIIAKANPKAWSMSETNGRVDLPVKVSVNVDQFISQLKEGTFEVTLTAEQELPTVSSFTSFAVSESTPIILTKVISIHVENDEKKNDNLPDTGLVDTSLYTGALFMVLGATITVIKRREEN